MTLDQTLALIRAATARRAPQDEHTLGVELPLIYCTTLFAKISPEQSTSPKVMSALRLFFIELFHATRGHAVYEHIALVAFRRFASEFPALDKRSLNDLLPSSHRESFRRYLQCKEPPEPQLPHKEMVCPAQAELHFPTAEEMAALLAGCSGRLEQLPQQYQSSFESLWSEMSDLLSNGVPMGGNREFVARRIQECAQKLFMAANQG
jgi:hypothetical protein